METDLVRGVGNQLSQMSVVLQQKSQQLNYSVQTLSSAWQGNSASIFVSEIQLLLQQLNQYANNGDLLYQRLCREINEWEQIGAGLSGTPKNNHVVATTNVIDRQVPDSVLGTVLKAEEQWQEDLSFLRERAEENQDNLALKDPGEAFNKNNSIGRYNMEPQTAKDALEWAFRNGEAGEYGFSEMPSDEKIVKLIMDKDMDSKLAALRLSQLKDSHPQLSKLSWEEIDSDPNYVAKLYSGYMGAGGAWDQWKSDLEPGSEAKKRLGLGK